MTHVHLVDDDDDLRHSLAELLEDEGFRVTQSTNGREALDRLADDPADVILLDYMMPEMDGLAFRKAQRERPELAQIPVVLLTAANATPEREAVDAEAVVEKPFPFQVLLSGIEQALGHGGP